MKIGNRSKSFFDHISQATLFVNSQSKPEQQHLIDALTFEQGKVEKTCIGERCQPDYYTPTGCVVCFGTGNIKVKVGIPKKNSYIYDPYTAI